MLKAAGQWCRVHFIHALALAGNTQRCRVSVASGMVFVQDTAEVAKTQWRSVADPPRTRFPKLSDVMDAARKDVLAFTTIPRARRVMYIFACPGCGLTPLSGT